MLLCVYAAHSRAIPARFGITVDSSIVAARAAARFDSLFAQHPQINVTKRLYAIERSHPYEGRTAEFYLIVALCGLLGAIRVIHPRYFSGLWRVFYNPEGSARAVREWPAAAALPNLLMNLFFACSAGAYLYCVVRVFNPGEGRLPPSLLLLALVGCVLMVYGVKWVVARGSGWAFGVGAATEQYLFNVFLMNKVIGVVLLPFVVLLAFGDKAWAGPLVVVSAVVVGVIVLMRYGRSWPVLKGLFHNSRFHFLAYLCASEILPLAVLTKLLVRWLLG